MSSEWVTGPENISFYTKRWTVPEPKAHVVFVHGIIEHVERYNYFFESFAKKGISVFAFDQRGWGQTGAKTKSFGITGIDKQLRDVEFFLAQEESKSPGIKIYLYGHSMGGGIVLNYACLSDPSRPSLARLSGLIASAPMIQQPPAVRVGNATLAAGGALGWALPSLQMKIKILGDDLTHDKEINEAYVQDPLCSPITTFKQLSDMFKSGSALLKSRYRDFPTGLPLLMYHGTADKVTYFDASKEFEEKVVSSDKTFMPFDDYYHELHNEPGEMKERVIDAVTQWILQRS